jgi:ribonuclease T2
MRLLSSLHHLRFGVISVFACVLVSASASAQDKRQNEPGQFDFYVLALSWSPSFCEQSRERAPDRAPDQQCSGKPYSFVVHGLWPQYEAGFPEFCQVPAPRLDRATVTSGLEVMPSPRLVFNQWGRHGTCSGLTPHAYFETVHKARAVVKIPAAYLEVAQPLNATPDEVGDAFVKANPGLTRKAISISCDGKQRLSDVRICLSKDLHFRDCVDLEKRACRQEQVLLPAPRGG